MSDDKPSAPRRELEEIRQALNSFLETHPREETTPEVLLGILNLKATLATAALTMQGSLLTIDVMQVLLVSTGIKPSEALRLTNQAKRDAGLPTTATPN